MVVPRRAEGLGESGVFRFTASIFVVLLGDVGRGPSIFWLVLRVGGLRVVLLCIVVLRFVAVISRLWKKKYMLERTL